ncbi:NAD(P)H-dependent FMN reductase [Pseudohyphozyma bogoriensis]|nr:NAD(P)H-dependent FMN reductase [Pseudohyphozyma bogoriensis]
MVYQFAAVNPVCDTVDAPVVGVLSGSNRPSGNGVAITSWIVSIIKPLLPKNATIKTLDATQLGLITSPLAPFQIAHRPDGYPDEPTRAWSAQVESCTGFVIVTPQHNFGYPAYVKNAIDHLSVEWQRKPVRSLFLCKTLLAASATSDTNLADEI